MGQCGQNIFVVSTQVPWSFAIRVWDIEKHNFSYGGIRNNSIGLNGHYTQLVSASIYVYLIRSFLNLCFVSIGVSRAHLPTDDYQLEEEPRKAIFSKCAFNQYMVFHVKLSISIKC